MVNNIFEVAKLVKKTNDMSTDNGSDGVHEYK